MSELDFFALIFALIWGAFYAWFLQTRRGMFLAARYTWLTVVIGDGVNIAIARLVIGSDEWLKLAAIFVLAGIPIIARSIINDQRDSEDLLHANAKQDTTG